MSCHGCATPFGFFKKEVGCPKCGFSFCKNCLRFKIPDSNKDKSISVCQICYTNGSGTKISLNEDELTRQWKETATVIRAVRRLESLENPAKPPITVYRENTAGRLANLQKGLSMEDQKIVERLRELRSGTRDEPRRKSDTAEEEVAARLAKLRGEEPILYSKESASGLFLQKKPETEEELLARLTNQVDIDTKYEANITGDINERLAKLRGTSNDPTSITSTDTDHGQSVPALNMDLDDIMDESSEEMSEEQQIQKIINQFVAEVALEEKMGGGVVLEVDEDPSSSTQPQSDSDHLESDDDDVDNLCRICDEKRATLKCKECDNDIFCRGCFKEFHLELGECHKATSFSTPR